MSRTYDRPIVIQKIDDITEKWTDVYRVHASINKAEADNEYLSSGAVQGKRILTFEMRYFEALEDVSFNLQRYRIVYRDISYNITDYDDYMLRHKTVRLRGVSY